MTDPSAGHDPDAADMGRLAQGHDPALNSLMERHAPRLFHYLLRSLQNPDDAADLAQETFVRVYQNRARFNPSHRFSTWLFAIATNLVKDRFRHRSRHPQVSLEAHNTESGEPFERAFPDPRPQPDQILDAHNRAQIIRQAIHALPDDLRTPLLLSEFEELSHAEIGQILQCSPKAVETRLYRARKQLRLALAPLLDATPPA